MQEEEKQESTAMLAAQRGCIWAQLFFMLNAKVGMLPYSQCSHADEQV